MLYREAEDEVLLVSAGERILPFLPVWHGPAEGSPELRPVVAFTQVNEFVSDDVIREPDRQLKQLPVEVNDSVPAARSPTKTQVTNLDPARPAGGPSREGFNAP